MRQKISPFQGMTSAALASGAAASIIYLVLGRAFQLATNMLLARGLGPDAYGLYALVWTFLSILILIAPLGLHDAIVRFGSFRRVERESLQRAALRCGYWSATVLALMFALGANVLARTFEEPRLHSLVPVAAVSLPLAVGLRLAAAASRASGKIRQALEWEEFARPASACVLIALVLVSFEAVAAVYVAIAASYAVCAAAMHRAVRIEQRSAHPVMSTWSLLRFSTPVTIASIVLAGMQWADRIFVGYFMESADVGLYQAASQLGLAVLVPLNGLRLVGSPWLATYSRERDRRRLQDTFSTLTKWAVFATLPMVVPILTLPRSVLWILFGSEFALASHALVILAFGQLINVWVGPIGALLVMSGNQKAWAGVSLLGLLLNMVANLILVPRYGLVGAALATAATTAMMFLSASGVAAYRLGVRTLVSFPTSAALLGPQVVVWAIATRVMPAQPSHFGAVITVVTASAVGALASWFLVQKTDSDHELAKQVRAGLGFRTKDSE